MNIVWKRPDGSLLVTHLTASAVSPEHEAEKLMARGDIPPDAVIAGYNLDLPADRTFRNAWVHDTTIKHDMSRCKDLWRNKIRAHRAAKLAALDIEYQRADEASDTNKKQQVAAKKIYLRDLTQHPSIEGALTPDELKAFWPEELGPRDA